LVPLFASIIAFIVYAALGNDLSPGVIFASFALFNAVRVPITMYPMVLALYVDAKVSLERVREFLLAEELDSVAEVDPNADDALLVKDATFVWETPPPAETKEDKKQNHERKKWGLKKKFRKSSAASTHASNQPTSETPVIDESQENRSYSLRNINLRIPRGALVAVVGPVGSGKSSLLNALVGEMKRVKGSVTFGGSVGYCSQSAWIQNATVRNNIIFGLPYDEARYQSIIRDCALEHDLEILPGKLSDSKILRFINDILTFGVH
jgi:ABC-type multidrug transport system fused ATPase/permease subunit